MPRRTLYENRQIGLDFIEFLGESNRRSVKFTKQELKDIYNNEFRDRDAKDSNFSNVLFALCHANKARIIRGRVHIDPRVRLLDQWRQPRNPPAPPPPLANGAAAPAGVSEPESAVKARRQLAASIYSRINRDRSEFIADRGGVRISSGHQQGEGRICVSVQSAAECEVQLCVENTGDGAVLFTYYSLLHWVACFSLEDEQKVTRARPLHLPPGEQYGVTLRFRARHVGFYQATLVFEFRSASAAADSPPFHVLRFIEGMHTSALTEALAPIAPYTPRRINASQHPNARVEDGVRPDSFVVQNLKQVLILESYDIPLYIVDLISYMTQSRRATMDKVYTLKALLESPLSFENYTERFQVLLQLEETQMQVDIRTYDMQDAKMDRDPNNKNNKLLVLKVPGVAENRPSVLRGDHLLVIKSKERHLVPVTQHKGYVHRVEWDQVKLGFGSKLLRDFVDGMGFDVEFTVNRLPIRLQHRAVELATEHHLRDLLFPTGAKVATPAELPVSRLRDRKLESNSEQYSAVQSIVAGVSRPAPYLLFGPPGTGKTVTVVEAIKQLYDSPSCSHILACAPSNSAADLLCEKILEHADQHQVYRLYASSRDPRFIPLAVLECCNFHGDDIVFPSKEVLLEYKILVTTVVTAGRLVSGGLHKGHFSHIFIDEAGHAPEPEVMIPVAGLLDPKSGQLVLAGDPKQLGPILRSPIAKKHGLELSLLERLMKHNPLYQKDETGHYNSRYVTKLLLNYRSHKSILKIPNDLFYDGELVASADEMSTHMYCTWEHLPKQNFPLIFHGVIGKDEMEANSPSFFNRSEIDVVMGYLKKLLLEAQGKKGVARISPKDIGIIAPYRKQVEKIRQAIERHDKELKKIMGIENLKVGSVEEFQGQERRVIIVSCVRSSGEHLTFDEKFNIGFLKNEKRFNVAMTRAKALLIVVGNPIILRTDPSWGRFLEYCSSESGYTGYDFSSTEGVEQVMARLTALNIGQDTPVDTGESVVQQMLDPEWRNEQ
ncbi:putative helicase mov-10-B.1 isoform X2 [Alosa sapidissima]|uniref:putative helicase mov-10-B.1 isoform X2 n=1 Tax=Alosa sapidissima TaxID=34773 RepID=UPI001C08F9BA|nr:putative helicase mov-10-B.1 isoform X2 [Alosa sapidissima]